LVYSRLGACHEIPILVKPEGPFFCQDFLIEKNCVHELIRQHEGWIRIKTAMPVFALSDTLLSGHLIINIVDD
jgi:hypothetical protein